MNTYTAFLLKTLGKDSIYFTGQAGFIFRSRSGMTLGVDLYLSDCVERLDGPDMKRLSPKVVAANEVCLDYIVATHHHWDHFDVDAMPVMMSNTYTKLIAAEDCREHVRKLMLDLDRISFVKEKDTVQCGDFLLHAVFCDHGEGAPLAVGLVLEFDGLKIYIAGDTCLRLDKAQLIAQYGPFDVMIAPINGAFGNLNEYEAISLCEYHKPLLMIPCHYWTFAGHHGDPGIFQQTIKERLPQQRYQLMAQGEWINIG